MNFLDWILIVLFALGALWGLKTGLVGAFFNVVVIYVALLLSGLFAGQVLDLFWDGVENESVSTAIGYVVIFAVVYLAGKLATRIVRAGLKITMLGWVDRLGGLAVGVVAGFLLAGGMMAVMARYTYVIEDRETAGISGGLSKDEITARLRNLAEDHLADSARENVDGWLVGSEVVPVLIDVRNVLPGGMLGMAPSEFGTAIDILESKTDIQSGQA